MPHRPPCAEVPRHGFVCVTAPLRFNKHAMRLHPCVYKDMRDVDCFLDALG
jgi:hypothetical protein